LANWLPISFLPEFASATAGLSPIARSELASEIANIRRTQTELLPAPLLSHHRGLRGVLARMDFDPGRPLGILREALCFGVG